MWTDVRQATAWAFLWIVALLLAFLFLRQPDGRPHPTLPPPKRRWLIVLLAALLARLVPTLLLPVGATYDIESYKLVTDGLLGGQEVYAAALGRHPYLPFQMVIMGASALLAQWTFLPYVVAIKLPTLLADVAITALIIHSARRERLSERYALHVGWLYALNPVSILVTAYHGQFEAVTLLLALLAWFYWRFGRRPLASAAGLGLAILNKTWPVIFLPLLVLRMRSRREQLYYAAVAIAIPTLITLAYILLFSPNVRPMLLRILTHRGVAGYWGPTAVLAMLGQTLPAAQSLFDTIVAFRTWLLLAAGLAAVWLTRQQSLLDAMLTTLLCIFVVTIGIGIQWLVWLVPFAVLAGEERRLKWYSVAATFMLIIHLYGLHMYPWLSELLSPPADQWLVRLSGLPAWIIATVWAAQRLQLALRAAEAPGVQPR